MKKPPYSLEDARMYEKSRDYLKAADIYCELGEYAKAEALFRALEQQFPFHKEIKFKFGKLLAGAKQWNEAIIKLQEAEGAGTFQEERLYLLAECFTQKGFLHAAKEMYVELLDRNYHYKDARKKLQMLDAPSFAAFATNQQQTMITSGEFTASATEDLYQTMQGIAVEDRYTLLEELGRGGMGIVYKAQDTASDRIVAIKVLPPYLATEEQNRLRFFREAEVIARLNHPHIVRLFEVNQQEHFLVMEYIPGGTLHSWKQQQGMSTEKLLLFLIQILDALHVVHQQGIIHRDLKPENILIADPSTAKLTDFGIAHICGATITHTGTHLGTIPYMAPEQIIGHRIDWRADIYAIGVILYEFLAGELPFSGQDTSYHHVHTTPRAPRELVPTLAPELEHIILKCLAKSPDDRFHNAKTLQSAIEKFSNDSGFSP
ncbi:serine/threonine protein kinase with PASTA sensor(S) [Candidatus Vecturithrix granuli]|uniref:non-specific serine/threonine protein kinase n=1 Tax=Vecturithrix granuli TaxID=1499967 RepID=A0A081C613_VECG1|nr:serine/threonine protein kinase with PASTA sensor(S) [Candidatus Vecturithrix granuli]